MKGIQAAVAILLIATGTPAALAGTRSSPTPAQIRTAVRRAERSATLWATVNICDTARHRHIVGIRGQMAALGFPAELAMDVTADYWNAGQRRFEPIPSSAKHVSLGTVTYGTVQSGATFTLPPPVLVRGTVSFTWSRGHRILGRVTKLTHGGEKGVDDSDPRGYSAATCRVGR